MNLFGYLFMVFLGLPQESKIGVRLIEANPFQCVLDIFLEEIAINRIKEGEKYFYEILTDDYGGYTNEIGRPKLPAIRRFVEIPTGAAPVLSYDNLEEEVIKIDFPVYPIQEPILKVRGAQRKFSLDEKFYKAWEKFYPEEFLSIREVGIAREHRIFLLEFYPIRYNPSTSELKITKRIRVTVKHTGGDLSGYLMRIKRYYSPPFERFLEKIVINHHVYESLLDIPNHPIGYLIITHDIYYDSLMKFVRHKTLRGHHITVKRLSEFNPPDTTRIRMYIQNAYFTWEIPPIFVLLVGESYQVPFYRGVVSGNPATDLYYSTVSGTDYFPDVFLARWSVANITQLMNILNKTIKYENLIWPYGREWARKGYFMASNDPYYHQIAEGTHLYCMVKIRGYGMLADSLFAYYNSGTPVSVALNNGRTLAIYSGHGDYTLWDGPYFTSGDVNNLQNTGKYPWVQSYACLTGDFTYSECFMETWIRAYERGSVLAFGSSTYSYWNEDDILQRRLFDVHFDSSVTWAMGAINGAKFLLYLHYGGGGNTRRYFEMYNLLGDPSLDIFTKIPDTLIVIHPNNVPIGYSEVTVSVYDLYGPVNEALVSITQNYQIINTGFTNSQGVVTIPIQIDSPDSLLITVTAHNHIVYQASIYPVSVEAYLMVNRVLINDDLVPPSYGNGDGIVNPYEILEIGFSVVNYGSQSASNINCFLRSAHEGIIIIDSTDFIPYVNPMDTVIIPQAFVVHLFEWQSNGTIIPVTILFISQSQDTWVSHKYLRVGTPIFVINGFAFPEEQIPNGRLDPGETAGFYPILRNAGGGWSYTTRGILRSLNPYVEVIDSTAIFNHIPPDSQVGSCCDAFRIRALPNTPQEYQANMRIIITYSDNFTTNIYTDSINFILVVGQITAQDPTGPDLYGYYAYGSNDTLYTQAPTYQWREIYGIGTPLNLSDDQTVQISLPFVFKYYGTNYNILSICSNGWIAMGITNSTDYSNSSIPNSDGPPNMIAPFWDDLNPASGGLVCYYYDSPLGAFIVEWYQVPHYGSPSIRETFQVILFNPQIHPTPTGDGVILFQYHTVSDASSATVGIENYNQTVGIEYFYLGTYPRTATPIHPGLAIKFTTSPPEYVLVEEKDLVSFRDVRLFKPYPNPTQNTFNLKFTLPEKTQIDILLLDVTGRVVDKITSGEFSRGLYELTYNKPLKNGVYFILLKTKHRQLIEKLIITN